MSQIILPECKTNILQYLYLAEILTRTLLFTFLSVFCYSTFLPAYTVKLYFSTLGLLLAHRTKPFQILPLQTTSKCLQICVIRYSPYFWVPTLLIFSCCCNIIPDMRFILGIQSIILGKAWQWQCETAGHAVSGKSQRILMLNLLFLFVFFIQPETPAYLMVLPTFRSPIWKLSEGRALFSLFCKGLELARDSAPGLALNLQSSELRLDLFRSGYQY